MIIEGRLVRQDGGASAANYVVEAKLFSTIGEAEEGDSPLLVAPLSASTIALADGSFQIDIEAQGTLQGPVDITVSAPNGFEISRRQFSLVQVSSPLELKIRTRGLFKITPGAEPGLGKRRQITGQVIDEHGRAVPAGLPVAIWGVDLQESDTEPDARPVVLSQTQIDGKFSADWPTRRLVRAFGRVSGSAALPVPLDDDNRLVRSILLVLDLEETAIEEGKETADRACRKTAPRSPEPIDVTENPSAFSQDLGSACCVDLTVPNRTLEEFSYFQVVRTSEPQVRGVTLGGRRLVPSTLMVDLLSVSKVSAALRGDQTRASLPAGSLGLDLQAAKALVRHDRPPTLAQIERAVWLSEVDYARDLIGAGLRKKAGRALLDADRPIDWDDTPTIHLSINIAHGHILRYREVWRADGYSLGNLLYSLPLAPGQRRKVAVVDWERRSRSAREERLEFEEELDALLSRDRDVMEIVGTHLQEETSAGSRNTTWGAAAGIGAGFIGSGFGIFGGAAGGGGGSDSQSWQRSARQFSANSQQQLRDRVAQRSAAVRSQRSTVVQSVAQSETLRAETEVVANYNRCHAITVEYFEVLRHFLITHELADVQECLFVPLPTTQFNRAKALRWQEPLTRYLKDRRLRVGFQSIARIADRWEGWDYPESRYSEEAPTVLEGELRISFLLPRPRDDEDGQYQVDMWRSLAPFLPVDPLELFTARLNDLNARMRDRVFRQEIAPEIAQNLIQRLRFAYVGLDGSETALSLDATLVSRYRESAPLYVTLNPLGELPNVPREDIAHFKVWYDGPALPPDAQVIVRSGRLRYRTDHITALLFSRSRILDDLRNGDPVVIPTPVSRRELRNPRAQDREMADRLVAHLNEQLEYYHQAIWISLDAQRRYMLLDSVLVPGLGGRSIASVCTNELIGIVGNSLVLPAAPGQRLDLTIDAVDKKGNPIDLREAYATAPTPPLRVSVPTRGVYAEAVSGECNACELIDDSRYWRWHTEGQLALPEIGTAATSSRSPEEPDLKPTALPSPLVSIQNAPVLPNPFGLGAAFELLSKPELFRDITGLEGTQKNAQAAFDAALSAASAIGTEAAQLARQNELSRNAERMLNRIDQARADGLLSQSTAQSLANSALKGLIGEKPTPAEKPTDDKAVEKAIDETAQSAKGDIKVSTPDETVEVSFDDKAPVVGAVPAIGQLDLQQFVDLDIVKEWKPGSTVPAGSRSLRLPILGISLPYLRLNTVAQLEKLFNPGAFAFLESKRLVKRNPADTSKFQLSRRLRIVYPAVAGNPSKVAGSERLPVVAILHGQHAPLSSSGAEIPNHEGYTYLQRALAQHNVVSVSIDTNMANLADSYIEMRAEYMLNGLDALRAMDGDKTSRFHQRLDFDKVMFVGHSRGGDAAIRAAELNATRSAVSKFGLKAVCAIAPTDFSGSLVPAEVRSLTPADTPFLAVLYGALDGDVAGWQSADSFGGTGFRHYDRATCNKSQVFFDACSHNRFNSVWTADEAAILPGDIGRVLSRSDHEKLASEFVGALALWKLLGQSAERGLFNGDKTSTVTTQLSRQYSFGRTVKPIDLLAGVPNVGTRTPASAAIAPFHKTTIGSRRNLNFETNHTTTILTVNPNLPGPTSAAWKITLKPADGDLSSFDELVFSVSGLFDLTNRTTISGGLLPDYTVVITDAAGGSSTFNSLTLARSARRPVFHEAMYPPIVIASSTAASPTVIRAPGAKALKTGDEIVISGHSGAPPTINGRHKITRITPTTFSVPVSMTSAGSGGRLRLIENCTALRLETIAVDLAPIRFNSTGLDLTQVATIAIHPPAGFPQHMFFDAMQLIKF